ncbi:hypothetical protein V5O48_017073 [Marasmius crinis-equi]|uniref:Uncharacterized protein n=1 Tax=Marasmius crinis-equi TaxID=585013 RepID=A0ABR3EPZ2_9AGAR
MSRMAQIRRWLHYHSKNDLTEAHVLFLNQLAAQPLSDLPKCQSSAYNLWYKSKNGFLEDAIEQAFQFQKAEFEKRREAAGGTLFGKDGKVLRGPPWLPIRQEIVKRHFDQLPKQEQND